jgi:hypothetical protein
MFVSSTYRVVDDQSLSEGSLAVSWFMLPVQAQLLTLYLRSDSKIWVVKGLSTWWLANMQV